jgi:hypothetical protein
MMRYLRYCSCIFRLPTIKNERSRRKSNTALRFGVPLSSGGKAHCKGSKVSQNFKSRILGYQILVLRRTTFNLLIVCMIHNLSNRRYSVPVDVHGFDTFMLTFQIYRGKKMDSGSGLGDSLGEATATTSTTDDGWLCFQQKRRKRVSIRVASTTPC